MGTVDRRQGSGRPRSAPTDENIDQVNDMVLSPEDQPRTHNTVREISRKTLRLGKLLEQQLTALNALSHS